MFRISCIPLIALLSVVSTLSPEGAGNLTITILYDNYQFNKDLATGWGFSCLVEGTEKTILFDIASDMVLRNMEKLGMNPGSVDVVVFSHIHQDHTAGTLAFLKENSSVKVYVPQSFPQNFKDGVKNAGAECVDVQKPVQICADVHSTGELTTGVREQGLVIKTAKGLVVITGCAHPGIVNMVKKAKEATQEENVYLVLGGFHLLQMSGQRIKEIISELRKENVNKLSPTHCTGDLAISLFKEEYGDDFIPLGAGKEIKIEDAFPQLQGTGINPEAKETSWACIKTQIVVSR